MTTLDTIADAWVKSGRDITDLTVRLRKVPEQNRNAYLNDLSGMLGVAQSQDSPQTPAPETQPQQPKREFIPDNPRTFIPDKPEIPKGKHLGYPGSAMDTAGQTPSGSLEAMTVGTIDEASFGQMHRSPQASKELKALEQERPFSYGAGRMLGFSAGFAGQLLSFIGRSARGTRLARWVSTLAPTGIVGKMALGVAKTGASSLEAGAVVGASDYVKPGVSGEQAFESAKMGAAASVVLFGGGRLALGTLKTISPRFSTFIENLDDVVKIKREGTQKVLGDTVEEMQAPIAEARQALAQETQQVAQAVDDHIAPVIDALDNQLQSAQAKIASAVSQKISDARNILVDGAEESMLAVKGSRQTANQIYKQGYEQVAGKLKGIPIKTSDVADDFINVLQERAMIIKKGATVLPNKGNPYVAENMTLVDDLIGRYKALKAGKMSVDELNLFKQNIGELADFGKGASKESLGYRNLYSLVAQKLEDAIPGLKTVNRRYSVHRGLVDDVTRRLGMDADTVSGRFESLVAAGNQAGKRAGLAKDINRLGKLDPRVQASTTKSLQQANQVLKLTQLDAADSQKVGKLLQNSLVKGKAFDKQRLTRIQEHIGKIEQLDEIRGMFRQQGSFPGLDLKKLSTVDGAREFMSWIDQYAPNSKQSAGMLVRQARKFEKLDKLLPSIDSDIEHLLTKEFSEVEARALKLLPKFDQRFAPLFKRGALVKAIGKEGLGVEIPTYFALIRKAYSIPEETAALIGRMKIKGSAQDFHDLLRNLIVILNTSDQ